jgi:hypothetical protein
MIGAALAGALALTASGQSPAAAVETGQASCAPSVLGRSALLDGAVTVSPEPGSRDASPSTQISLLGVPASELGGIVVKGSSSGLHAGSLRAYSQGDGGSFLPSRPFKPGEQVSVTGTLTLPGQAAEPFSYSFQVAVPDTFGEAGGSTKPPTKPSDYQRFRSRPDLQPPLVTVTAHTSGASPGELLLAPYSGPGRYGPMILAQDGSLLWFDPLSPAGTRAADLRVQTYEGKRVLTWWQDPLTTGSDHQAGIVIDSEDYEPLAVVRAGNGYQADLHEFLIEPSETALITVYDGIDCNLSKLGGPARGAVADTLVQELDLRTGLVRYEWHALDHVQLSDAYVRALPGSLKEPFDYFHVNSAEQLGDGDLLIDSRNTWAAYEVDQRTGQVRWRLGGKQSSFKLGPGAQTAFQHDARMQPDGALTFFDNGGTPKVHSQSRVLEVTLNATTMTATLARSDEHSPALLAGSQGNLQALADGNWMVGWGQEPYFTEFDPAGRPVFDAHLPPGYESYRAYRQEWVGRPLTRPALIVSGDSAYVSWNGATGVASWRLLAGSSASALRTVAGVPRSGFETAIPLDAPARSGYVQVQALSASGSVLGSSPARRG